MSKKMNLRTLKVTSLGRLRDLSDRLTFLTYGEPAFKMEEEASIWVFRMSVVDVHTIWERFAEDRLALAINHHPSYFLLTHDVRGVRQISQGLAYFIVRGGSRHFDFRSMSDLIRKANTCVGADHNPFRELASETKKYLDTLAIIRNYVVHRSDAAAQAYKNRIKAVYSSGRVSEPEDFLRKKDKRPSSPSRNKEHIYGLIKIVEAAIDTS
jgi:hypothetical protein